MFSLNSLNLLNEEKMDYLEYDIMTRYPLLSASEDLKKWTGFISTQPRAVLISLAVPRFPLCKGTHLDTGDLDEKTANLWNLQLDQIPMAKCNTFLEYLEMIEKKIINEAQQGENFEAQKSTLANSELYSAVIEEVEKIGVNNVINLSSDFKELVIGHEDRSGRQHRLKLSIPFKYPEVGPEVTAQLPFPPEKLEWPASIQEIHKLFMLHVEKCCNFWNDMDELDEYVKVIEPPQPNRGHFHRKILLEDNVMVHIIFDPLAPRKLPTINFSGPDKLADSFNATIDRECNMWDETMKVTQNLRSILGCEFIKKDSEEDDEDEPSPCTICYAYNFDDQIPEIACSNCEAVFHNQCLQDLFVSDVGKKGLRRFIACPNCEMEIMVPQSFAASSW